MHCAQRTQGEVDGIDGSGKSTLAKEVASKLHRALFSLDDYLDCHQGGFLEFIDYARLGTDASATDTFVIEGTCLLFALQCAGLQIDTRVYVKRRHLGYRADERELDVDEPLEDFLQNERKLTAMVSGESEADTELGLAKEVIRYRYAARPHDYAHIVYFRDEH